MTIFYNKSKDQCDIMLFYIVFAFFLFVIYTLFFIPNAPAEMLELLSLDKKYAGVFQIVLTLTNLVVVIGTYLGANSYVISENTKRGILSLNGVLILLMLLSILVCLTILVLLMK